MASKSTTLVLRGKANYAKILGKPIPNYNKDGLEWKMDLIVDKSVIKEMKALGVGDRVKQKDDYADGAPYLHFRHRELNNKGDKNKPIKVTDILGDPWDDDTLIGNGSVVDVKFDVVDYGPGMKHGVYIRSVRVLDLVPYNGEKLEPINEEDEYFQKAAEARRKKDELSGFKKDFGLDDSVSDIGQDEDEDEVV